MSQLKQNTRSSRTAGKGCGDRHCWHPSGTMITDGIAQSGTTDCRCCHCGIHSTVRWRMKTRRLRGHGEYESLTTLVYDEPVYGEQGSDD